MKNAIFKSILAVGMTTAVLASPVISTEALAKMKEQKFHFVYTTFGEPPLMTMKYKSGKWQWIDSGKSYKLQAKLKMTSSKKRIVNGSLAFAAAGTKKYHFGIWQQPHKNKAYKIEELVTFTLGKHNLSSSQGSAAKICSTFGGSKKTTMGMSLPARLYGASEGRYNKYGHIQMSVVCLPRVKPAPAKIAKIHFYTVPSQPRCNQPVSVVAQLQGTRAGKYDFTLVRNDGAKQKNSVVLTNPKPLASGQWMKTYTFKKSTKRRYQIVMANQSLASNWVDVKVSCGANADHKQPGAVKS